MLSLTDLTVEQVWIVRSAFIKMLPFGGPLWNLWLYNPLTDEPVCHAYEVEGATKLPTPWMRDHLRRLFVMQNTLLILDDPFETLLCYGGSWGDERFTDLKQYSCYGPEQLRIQYRKEGQREEILAREWLSKRDRRRLGKDAPYYTGTSLHLRSLSNICHRLGLRHASRESFLAWVTSVKDILATLGSPPQWRFEAVRIEIDNDRRDDVETTSAKVCRMEDGSSPELSPDAGAGKGKARLIGVL